MAKGSYQTTVPSIISGLVGRFVAGNPNNDGIQPANGSNLATWVDVSGGKITTTQDTVINQPVFNTNVSGGKSGITFSSDAGGANGDSLKTTVSTSLSRLNLANATTGFTIYVCARIAALTPPSGGTGVLLFMQGSSATSNAIYEVTQADSGAINNTVNDSSANQRQLTAGNAVAGVPFINTFWWDKSAATIYGQFNSNAIVTGAGAGTISALNTTPTLFAIGQQKNSQPTRQFDGTIFEILIYNTLHTTQQRLDITRYLSNQFGVSL